MYPGGIGFDGGIYSAGGRIVVNSTEILNCPMPVEMVQHVIDVMELGKLVYMLEGIYDTYIIKNGELSPVDLERFYAGDEPYRILEDRRRVLQQKWLQKHRKYPVYKIHFLTESRSTAEWLREKLWVIARVVRFDALVSDKSLTIGEVSSWGVNKGMALKYICRHLGVNPADYIAFGDSMNDAEMLQAAGLGIAMANSETGVKELLTRYVNPAKKTALQKHWSE